MDLSTYAELDAVGMAEMVRRGETSPLELAKAALESVARIDPHLNAAVEIYADALAIAATTYPDGVLAGVPTLRKDLGFTEAGRKAELGSALAAGLIADTTSLYWKRLRAAGAMPIGRSATSEFGIAVTIEPPGRPATVSPWGADLAAGGSSGGAAALVAAGALPFAHANDAGGSIRIPSALCGVAGFKPSRGRVSAHPGHGQEVFGMVAEMAVARSVRDLATVLDIVSAPAPGDPYAIRSPEVSFVAAASRPGRRLRIAFCVEGWLGAPVDAEAAAATRHAAEMLAASGHDVTPFALELDVELYLDTVLAAFSTTAAVVVDALARVTRRDASLHAHPVTLLWAEHGRRLGSGANATVAEGLNRITRAVGAQLASYDILLTPTLAAPGLRLDVLGGAARFANAAQHNERTEALTQFVTLFNVTGQPAVSLPLAVSSSGKPLGVQAVGRNGYDEQVISIAAELEAALPWRDRIPPVHVSRMTFDLKGKNR